MDGLPDTPFKTESALHTGKSRALVTAPPTEARTGVQIAAHRASGIANRHKLGQAGRAQWISPDTPANRTARWKKQVKNSPSQTLNLPRQVHSC
jgi:hypothetical protein